MSTIHSPLKHPCIQLSPIQESIQNIDIDPVVLMGGAGSGKTTALIHKLGYLFSQSRAFEKSTLYVTPLASTVRMVNNSIHGFGFYDFNSITFKDLCLQFLRKAVDSHLLIKDYLINHLRSGSHDQIQLLKDAIAFYKMSHSGDESLLNENEILDQIFSWKSKLVYPFSRWLLLPEELKNTFSFAEHENKAYELIYNYFEKFRIKKKLLGEYDIYLVALELFYSSESLKQYFTNLYSHILIDDVQETTNLEFEFIRLLFPAVKNITFSADPALLNGNKVLDHIQNNLTCQQLNLKINYRNIGKLNPEGINDFYLKTTEKQGNVFQNVQQETEFLTDKVRGLLNKNVSLNKIAILTLSEDQIPYIESVLIKKHIPYHQDDYPFFLKAPFLNLLRCLRFAIIDRKLEEGIFLDSDRESSLYFDDLQVLNQVLSIGLTKQELENIRKKLDWFGNSISYELSMICKNENPTTVSINQFLGLMAQLKSRLEQPANQILSWLYATYGCFHPVFKKEMKHLSGIEPLLNLCEPSINCIDFMTHIYQLAKAYKKERKSLLKCGISILALDQSKGQQWDYVFMTFPQNNFEDLATKELLYIGAGRAVKELMFSVVHDKNKSCDHGN